MMYKTLLELTQLEDSPFLLISQLVEGVKIEIFSYRLASWTDFEKPYATESRGIVFQDGKCICRPFEKFFNLGEGGMSMQDYMEGQGYRFENKEDGSLIAACKVDGVIHLKSKTSFHSDHAEAATRLMNQNTRLHLFIIEILEKGYTPLFEYVGPENQIILKYNVSKLILLACRNIETGEYMSRQAMVSFADQFKIDIVDELIEYPQGAETFEENMIKFVKSMENREGIVCVMDDGSRFKIKSEWYVARHHLKNRINTEFKLIELIVKEEIDDVIGLFGEELFDMPYLISLQEAITKEYNHIYKECEKFYETYKDLDRKEFAIKGLEIIGKPFFQFPMMKYLGKEVDFKEVYLRYKK